MWFRSREWELVDWKTFCAGLLHMRGRLASRTPRRRFFFCAQKVPEEYRHSMEDVLEKLKHMNKCTCQKAFKLIVGKAALWRFARSYKMLEIVGNVCLRVRKI